MDLHLHRNFGGWRWTSGCRKSLMVRDSKKAIRWKECTCLCVRACGSCASPYTSGLHIFIIFIHLIPMAILWPIWRIFPSFARHLRFCSQEISGVVSYNTFWHVPGKVAWGSCPGLCWTTRGMVGCTQVYIHRMGCAVPFLHFLHLFCSGALSEGRLRELSSQTYTRKGCPRSRKNMEMIWHTTLTCFFPTCHVESLNLTRLPGERRTSQRTNQRTDPATTHTPQHNCQLASLRQLSGPKSLGPSAPTDPNPMASLPALWAPKDLNPMASLGPYGPKPYSEIASSLNVR